jgi:hypothetical protein
VAIFGILASAELYDPSNGTWTTTGPLTTARNFHTATLLPDGRVLVTCGQSALADGGLEALDSAEVYTP